jgi:hypothetical protein
LCLRELSFPMVEDVAFLGIYAWCSRCSEHLDDLLVQSRTMTDYLGVQ